MPARPEITGRAPETRGLTEIELNSIVSLKRAVELSNLSEDTWRRRYAHLILKLSERRSGVRLRHALLLDDMKEGDADE
jgi:hypothetical protein